MTKSRFAAFVASVFCGGCLFVQQASARPGTPNALDVASCSSWYGLVSADLRRPAVCVKFQNTATEEVRFDVEMKSNGVPGRPPGSRLGCLIPTSTTAAGVVYQCTAADNFMGGTLTTRAAPSSMVPWLDALAGTPLGWGLGTSPTYQEQIKRLQEVDSKWQGFYLAELEFDTEYCVRVRARDTSDTVSEIWSGWDCERTRSAPPKPDTPQVKVEFKELRGTLNAEWSGGQRIGYYTLEGGASLNKYAAEVARLIPEEARPSASAGAGLVPVKRYIADGVELQVPYGLAKAMEGEAYLIKVCAYNYSGKACSDWASSLGTGTPRSIQQAGVAATVPVANSALRPSAGAIYQESDVIAAVMKPARCRPGLVYRSARPEDYVCVTPESQRKVGAENAQSRVLKDPQGAYGPETCRSGYVWREAFNGDTTCVAPERRTEVREENRLAKQNTTQ